MRILLVKNSVVPPIDYGGTERVVFWLAKSLKNLGHDVSLLAKEGSGVQDIPVQFIENQLPIESQIKPGFDIIHFHEPFNKPLHTPYIHTLHGVAEPGETYSKNTVFVSHNQASGHGGREVVYHGIDFDDYGTYNKNAKRDYIHFLAKTRWKIKNIDGAIHVARLAGKKLEIMGNRPVEKVVIKNLLNSMSHFNGMLVGERKNQIMAGSVGLLFPTLCQETFGLSMMESAYHGCPIYGTPYGSLPELITAELGYLSNKSSELAYAIKQAAFDFDKVHQYTVDHYSSNQMAINYLKVYERVANGETLHAKEPAYIESFLNREFPFIFD